MYCTVHKLISYIDIKFWTPFASNWFIFFIVIFLHVIWQKVNVHVVCDVNFVVCDDVSECDEFDF